MVIIGILIDQLSKWFVFILTYQTPEIDEETIQFIPGILHFTETSNRGAAFGMKILQEHSNIIFIIISSAVILGIYMFVSKLKEKSFWPQLSFGLITGGAIGNLIDRMIFGYVRDFVEILYPIHWPVFNMADAIICLGVTCFAIELLLETKADQKKRNKPTETTPPLD